MTWVHKTLYEASNGMIIDFSKMIALHPKFKNGSIDCVGATFSDSDKVISIYSEAWNEVGAKKFHNEILQAWIKYKEKFSVSRD